MGNFTSPKFSENKIPGSNVLHPDGLILGGLPEPVGSNDIDLQIDPHPADIGAMPYIVNEGPAVAPAATSVFGQINDADASAPSDRYLGFDPGGAAEWGAFLRHPWDALKARELGEQAKALTQKLYPNDPGRRHNDAADAFRHAYWSYTMARTFGPAEAQLFSNAHEISSPNPAGERYMDLYNNQVGRDLAMSGRGVSIDVIKSAIAKGSTRNSPFK